MAKRKLLKKKAKRIVRKPARVSQQGLFEKHSNLKWLLPLFILVCLWAVFFK